MMKSYLRLLLVVVTIRVFNGDQVFAAEQFDVVVDGGTPGGIAASVSAA